MTEPKRYFKFAYDLADPQLVFRVSEVDYHTICEVLGRGELLEEIRREGESNCLKELRAERDELRAQVEHLTVLGDALNADVKRLQLEVEDAYNIGYIDGSGENL